MFIVSSKNMTIVNLSAIPIASFEIRSATGTFALAAKYYNYAVSPNDYFYVHYSQIGWTEKDFKEFWEYYTKNMNTVKEAFIDWYLDNVDTDEVMTEVEAVKDFLSYLPGCKPCWKFQRDY